MKERILFLCTGNSARSQMAEALLRDIPGHRFEAASAGTHPAGLNLLTIEAMQEVGIDVRHQRSKHLEEFHERSCTYAVTVCDRAQESCPVFPSAVNMRHWSFEDPASAPLDIRLETFRRGRDESFDVRVARW